MTRFVLKKLAGALLVLLFVATAVFFLVRLLPGGPFDRARVVPAEVEAALRARYQLDAPLWVQYRDWLLGAVTRGDLGPSFKWPHRTVAEILTQSLPVSLGVGALALLVALLLGVPLGVLGALRRGRLLESAATMAGSFFAAVPRFVLGPLLVLVFSLKLGLLPAARWGTLRHWILPVLCAAAPVTAQVARLVQSGMREVLGAEFIRVARAKGLSQAQVVLRHALRPALLPVMSFLGPAAAGLLVGSVVVERVFDLPGTGRYFVDAALNRDYNLLAGIALVYAALLVTLDALADLGRALLDPRVEAR
jgi:oligopeptide transport system permease protein